MAEIESDEGEELVQEIPVQLQKWVGEEETQFEREFVESLMEALKVKRVDSSEDEEHKTKKEKTNESNNGGFKGEAMGGTQSELCTSVLHYIYIYIYRLKKSRPFYFGAIFLRKVIWGKEIDLGNHIII